MYILKLLIFLQLLFLVISNQNINPSPRTGPQDLLVTHYDCEENEQKTLHKYAINQVSQCENRTTSYRNHRCNSNTLFKSPSNKQLQVINSQQHFPKKKSTLFTSLERKQKPT